MIKRKCLVCNKIFYVSPSRITGVGGHVAKYCSKDCYSQVRNKELLQGGIKTRFKKGNKQSEKTIRKRIESVTGSNNKFWKGKDVGYRGLHYWVRRQNGIPKICNICGKKADDWANIDHKYKRNIGDYIPLCKSCHKKYDLSNNYNHR